MTAAPRIDAENWNMPPNVAYAFQRVQSLFPTARLTHDPERSFEFPKAERDVLGVKFRSASGEEKIVSEILEETHTDAFVVVKEDTIVAEHYFNGMTVDSHHLCNSVTKSVFGMLAGIAVDRGQLDPTKLVTDYLPEFAKSAWDSATVRQVLDMTDGVRFDESSYDDKMSDVWQYLRIVGWRPRLKSTADSIHDYAISLKETNRPHGEIYEYRTICTEVMGMLIENAMQRPLLDLMQDEIWAKLGTRHDGVIVVDPTGHPLAGAGLNVCARDLARFGMMLLNDGVLGGDQIVPASWIRDTFEADAHTKHCFELSRFNESMPGWHYRNQCWVPAGAWGRDALFGLGIHGQTLLVDQTNRTVIVKFSSQPEHDSEAMYLATIEAVNAVSNALAD